MAIQNIVWIMNLQNNKAVSEFKQYKEDNWTDIWIEHKLLLK